MALQDSLTHGQKCLIYTEGFCLPKEYNKNEMPKSNGTLDVQVKMRLENIISVDDNKFTIYFLTFIELYWEDPRINYIHNKTTATLEDIPLNWEWASRLWIPDVYVWNMKSVKNPKLVEEFGGES